MLINLSNHATSKWSELQNKTAVEKFSEIKDIPFPVVDPFCVAEEILLKAKEYVNLCFEELSKFPGQNNAVHIMGEYTLTYSIVNGLLKNGIKCISSTTERAVEEEGDKKITIFRFVKFREYKNI